MADRQHKKRELLASLPNDPAAKSAQSVADRSTQIKVISPHGVSSNMTNDAIVVIVTIIPT